MPVRLNYWFTQSIKEVANS